MPSPFQDAASLCCSCLGVSFPHSLLKLFMLFSVVKSAHLLVSSYYSLHTCPHVTIRFALKAQYLAPAIVYAVEDTQVVDWNVLSRDDFDSFLCYLATS